MKRFVSILCIAAMLLTLLAGCGSTKSAEPTSVETTAETAPETAPQTTAAPVTVRLGAMTGPTGIGMVKVFADGDAGVTENVYEKTIVGAADELTPKLLQGELDIVSVPSNLASVLYNKTEGGVTALAVNVLGVLYINEFNGDSIQSISDLKGKTVYATGKGSTPEYFLRYILTGNGLDPDKDVTIEWKSEPSEVVATLNADGKGIAMLPQPYVAAAAGQLGEGFRVALSVSDEWQVLEGDSLCTTACILVRTAFLNEYPEAVASFLGDFAASAAWVNANVDEAAELCGQYEIIKAPVAKKAITQCNVVCITGADMKAALGGCLMVLFDQNPAAVGGALPGNDFYYGG